MKLSMVLIIQFPQPFLLPELLDEGVSVSKMGNCFSFLQQEIIKNKYWLSMHCCILW